jgi:hypothetical protein
MRAALSFAAIATGLALTACSGPTGSPTRSASATQQSSPAPSASSTLDFPARTDAELARSELRDGAVTDQAWHTVAEGGTYVVKAACKSAGDTFAYQAVVNGKKVTSGAFACATTSVNSLGELSAGDTVSVRLTSVVTSAQAWAIVIPEEQV